MIEREKMLELAEIEEAIQRECRNWAHYDVQAAVCGEQAGIRANALRALAAKEPALRALASGPAVGEEGPAKARQG